MTTMTLLYEKILEQQSCQWKTISTIPFHMDQDCVCSANDPWDVILQELFKNQDKPETSKQREAVIHTKTERLPNMQDRPCT